MADDSPRPDDFDPLAPETFDSPYPTYQRLRAECPVAWTGAFGVCQWGRFTPGAAFDSPYESRFVPRYVGCADPGREGIDVGRLVEIRSEFHPALGHRIADEQDGSAAKRQPVAVGLDLQLAAHAETRNRCDGSVHESAGANMWSCRTKWCA